MIIHTPKTTYARNNQFLPSPPLHPQVQANAQVVQSAETYYRNMFFGKQDTWNLRDSAFLSTVQTIEQHIEKRGVQPKIVLWAHNSHLGDARSTDMGWRRGELNIGQLAREKYGADEVYNIGFTTHTGETC